VAFLPVTPCASSTIGAIVSSAAAAANAVRRAMRERR